MTDVSKSRRQFTHAVGGATLAAALPAGAPAQAARPRVLRYAFRIAETGFDPAQVQDLYSATVMANIFDAPLTYDYLARPAQVVPNTAVELPEISADYTTFTFRIRPGIFFADDPAFKGQRRELVAQDYVYAVKRIYDPRNKSPRVYLFETAGVLGLSELRAAALKGARFDYDTEVEGLRALDRHTFRVRLSQPGPRFFYFFADNSTTGAVAREVVEFYGPDKIMAHPVGTGPFRLADWRRSSRIVLERNPAYRDETYGTRPPADDTALASAIRPLAGRKLPMLDRVEISIIEEDQPRWLAFLNAEHDLVDEIPRDMANLIVPNGALAPNLVRRNIGVDRSPRANVDMMLFNMEHPLVGGYSEQQVALRRAIALAYNVDEEIRLVRRNQSIPSQSPVAPLTSGFDPAFRSEMSEFNRARARALLDTYGFIDRDGDGWRERPDGSPLVLAMSTQTDGESRQLDEQWRKHMATIGLQMEFRPAKWPENLKNSRAGKLMMWRVGWVAAQPDGDTFLALGFGPNKGQANHARFDLARFNDLYARQRQLPDGPERERLFHEAKRLFVAYMPYKFVGHRLETSVWHPWVIGFRRHPFMRDFFKYIDIDPDHQSRASA